MRLFNFEKTDLEHLMSLTGISVQPTQKALAHVLQKAWLRPAGKERWELPPLHEDKREQLLPLFRKMGLVDAVKIEGSSYEHLLLMGGAVCRMVLRAKTLKKLLKTSLSYQDIIFLAGDRSLTNDEKKCLRKRKLHSFPETEAQLYPAFFECEGLPVNEILCVDTCGVHCADGTFHRATTADTLRAWLATEPRPGSVLVISSQPLCLYQKTVVELLLPKEFQVSIIGERAPLNTSVAFYLDTIARICGVITKQKKGEII